MQEKAMKESTESEQLVKRALIGNIAVVVVVVVAAAAAVPAVVVVVTIARRDNAVAVAAGVVVIDGNMIVAVGVALIVESTVALNENVAVSPCWPEC